MLNIPVLRWGQPYTSMDIDQVVHFATGEPIAKVSRANGGLIQRDMRKADRARSALRAIPMCDLIARVKKAGELYMDADLPLADGTQTPDEFVRAQSASTGLPEHMCRANMKKNAFVLAEMPSILASLTRDFSRDAVSHARGVFPSRHSARGDLGVSGGRRRRRRCARRVRSQLDLWRHGDSRSVPWKSTGPGTWAGVLEDSAGRRPGRQMGAAPRCIDRQRVRE